MDHTDVEIIERVPAFQGYFRIDRYRLRHRLHAGGWSEPMSREVFERGHAVCVLPYDPRRDEVVLIEQFRVGAYAAGFAPWLIEIVAGIIDPGETAVDVAHREMREEAGLVIETLEPICRYLVSPGGTTESVELFCGRVDASTAGGIFGLDQEHEDIRVMRVPATEALNWLAAGRIVNAAAVIALQWLALNREKIRLKWVNSK
ncbi:MAG: ADP-ribose diphosphatase [Alphaproteobacteria bacterium]